MLGPGAIIAVGKLKNTRTGDTLSDDKAPFAVAMPQLAPQLITFALAPKEKGDEDKVYAAVQKLRDGRRVRTAVYRHVYHSVRPALYLGNDGVRLGVQRALVAHGLALPGKGCVSCSSTRLSISFASTGLPSWFVGRKQAAAPQGTGSRRPAARRL